MDPIIKQYLSLIGGAKIISIFVLIILDTILGVFLAVKNKTFKWSRIADFLDTSVLMMFGGYFLLGIFAMAESSFQVVVPVTLGIIDAKLIADIVQKFQAFGINTSPVAPAKKS
jgi:hypothetical protein